MRPQDILGLLLRAFGVWLLVTGLIALPSVIEAHRNARQIGSAMTSIATSTGIPGSDQLQVAGPGRAAMISELLQITIGAALLFAADGLTNLLYGNPSSSLAAFVGRAARRVKPFRLLIIGLLLGTVVGILLAYPDLNHRSASNTYLVLAWAGLGLAIGYVADVYRRSRAAEK